MLSTKFNFHSEAHFIPLKTSSGAINQTFLINLLQMAEFLLGKYLLVSKVPARGLTAASSSVVSEAAAGISQV
jgi:hypothetical protein